MPFPLPTPEELTRRQEAEFEAALRRYADAKGLTVSPEAIARAVRSPHGLISAFARVNAQALYEAHLHLRWWGDQYMPDTAEIENLERHCDIWGIVRRPATKAIGKVTFEGANGTVIPLGLELIAPSGALFETTETGPIAAGVKLVTVRALEAGSGGNVAAAERLTLVSPLGGLSRQDALVDADGLAGGAAIETDTSLLERLLERIQDPPHGGAAFDYPVWVKNAFAAAHVKTLPNWVGRGTVGVAVAMGTKAAPRAPTPAEITAIGDYLGTLNSQTGVRPVTAEVLVLAAAITPIALTIAIDPDEVRVRTAITEAHAAFYVRDAAIGGVIFRSRLSEALSSAAGEYRHELIAPAANVVSTALQLPTPGAITWAAP